MNIRPYKKGDESQIVRLINDTWRNAYSHIFPSEVFDERERTIDERIKRFADNKAKGNICFVFFVENAFRVILYIWCGIITFETLKKSLLLVPVMLVGVYAGMASSNFLDEKIVKKIVLVMLIVSGVALIINSL